MPASTELWRAHDIAQRLQDKIELLPNVERAFVHVDHETEHRPVRFVQRSRYCLAVSETFVFFCRNIGNTYDSFDRNVGLCAL